MPKTLCNRLEDLENEIRVMVTRQEPTGSCCINVVRGSSVTSPSDGKVGKDEFEGATDRCHSKQYGRVTMAPPSCKPNCRPVSSPEACNRKNKSGTRGFKDDGGDGKHKQRQISSAGGSRRMLDSENKSCICTQSGKLPSCPCGQRRERTLKKCICGPKSGSEGGTKGEDLQNIIEQLKAQLKKSEEEKQEALNASNELQAKYKEIDLDKNVDNEGIIEQLKAQLKKSEEEKHKALNTSKELKANNEKMSLSKNVDSEELTKLKKEREELLKKLEREEKSRQILEEKTRQNAEKEKKLLAENMGKIELHAAKSAKQVRSNSDKMAAAVRQKDEHLRRLQATIEKLADSIQEKENENRKLLQAREELLENFMEAQLANQKLVDSNACLVRCIQEFREKLQLEKATVLKLQKQIAECKLEFRKAFEETERLKEKLKQLLKGPKNIREQAKLEEQLREAREREQKYLDEQAYLEAKMKDMQNKQDQSSKNNEDELQVLIKDYKKLQAKYEDLTKTLQVTREENEKQISKMEEAFEKNAKEMKTKQDVLAKEKAELQATLGQLTETSKRDRKALEDTIKRVEQQDRVLKSQQETIAAKDKQMQAAEAQISDLKTQAVQLNTQINKLQVSLKESEQATQDLQQQTQELQQQTQDLRKQLDEERELIVQKEKQLDEERKLIAQKEKLVAQQNTQTEQLNVAVDSNSEEFQKLLAEKEKLKKALKDQERKVENLGLAVDDVCRCKPGGDANQTLLVQLTQKVDVLQREATLQIQLVEKQKEQALTAAKFATNKLLQTVGDFQDQLKTQKKVQYMLTKMLQEKEEELILLQPKCCASKTSKKSVNFYKSNKVCCNPNCKNYQENF